jgi:hypothetical protein
MSYPSTVDAGGVSPAIIATEASSLAGLATTTLAANTIYLYAFELLVTTTFSGAKWRTGSTQTGSADVGIYSSSGTLLANCGGVTGAASTSVSQAFSGGNITLGPGLYYAAFTSANGTDTYVGINAPVAGGLIESRYRVAANTSSGTPVALNAATGTINNPSSTKMPAFSLTVVGGL